nr:hypothetical protein [Halorientalis salina]
MGENIGLVVDIVQEAISAGVFDKRAMSEEEIEVFEILKIALFENSRQVDLVVGIKPVTRRTIVETPLFSISEDSPVSIVYFLQIDVNLIARILEVALVFTTPTGVERPTPALGVRDGDGVSVEITALITTLKRTTSGVLGLEKAVVGTALRPTSTLLNLEGDTQLPEHRPNKLLFKLGLVAFRSSPLLPVPQFHDVRFRLAKFVIAEFVPRLGLGEVLIKVVVREQVAIRPVAE